MGTSLGQEGRLNRGVPFIEVKISKIMLVIPIGKCQRANESLLLIRIMVV